VHFLYPRIEERTQYKDREVIKYRTITRTITRPDGTKEEEKIEEGEKDKQSEFKQEKVMQRQYLAGLGATFEYGQFQQPEYNVIVGRRILGPVFGFVQASTERITVGALYEF
jgi:hypothetical protein